MGWVLNMSRILPFIGGLATGIAVAMIFLGTLAQMAALNYPWAFTIGIGALLFVGGLLVGIKTSPKPQEMKLTGRVFDFPQGSIMVEVALRRMRSILPTKVTESE